MPSRRLVTVLAAGLLPLALTACGSGQSPQTYEERPTADAVNASMGDLEVRNLHVDPPVGSNEELAAGEDATVTMSVVNQGEAGDRLEEVSTDAATSVEILDESGDPTDRVEVKGLSAVGDQDFSIHLVGLTQPIRPGQHIELTLSFLRAGRRTLTVPVAVYTSPEPRPTINVFEEHEGESAAEG